MHPRNSSIVALAVAEPTAAGLHQRRQGRDMARRDRTSSAFGGTGMFPVAATSVVIDPRGPATTGAADLQTLYLGSLAGVFVSRNITPDPAGPAPVWRTLNNSLPLTLIRDIEYGRYENPPGTLVRHYLRAASYGRGAFHLELDTGALGAVLAAPTTPNVRLLIRSTPIDDGQNYAGAARLANDPRLRDPDDGALTALTPHIAYDIRIDAPPFTFFDRVLDGAEFDEEVHSDKLVIGETNLINVQVHNTGFERTPDRDRAAGERCHRSPVFRRRSRGQRARSRCRISGRRFRRRPRPARPGRQAGEVRVHSVGPAQPRVARFEWLPPITLGNRVALLALASQSLHDDLSARRTAATCRWIRSPTAMPPSSFRSGARRFASSMRWNSSPTSMCATRSTIPAPAAQWHGVRGPATSSWSPAPKQTRQQPSRIFRTRAKPTSFAARRPGRGGCREFHLRPGVEQQERAAVDDGQALLCAVRQAVVSGRLDRGPRRHRERRSACERHRAAQPQILGRVPAHQSARSGPRTRLQGGGT